MKRFIIILAILFLGTYCRADETVLNGNAVFDWVDISQVQRDSQIEFYKEKIFNENNIPSYSKLQFKEKFAQYKKDSDYRENYRKTKMGQTETEDANLCAFFYKNDILLVYAIQYKTNPRNVYYYNAFGKLQYVDDISENYPNYPYNSKQYKSNGKLVSAIYFISPEIQYMYNPDGSFKGLWYKEKMYDKNGKQTVERTNWGI